MIHEILRVGPLQCNCSILGDEVSREAIVIDPGDDIHLILKLVAKHGLTVKQILVTHAHIDHIAGAHRLKQLTGAPVLFNQLDMAQVAIMDIPAGWLNIAPPIVDAPDADLPDLHSVKIQGINGTIHHTPGHTEGSVCLYLPTENLLIAGDTLFAGSIGRTDLPGGDMKKILRSIHDRLLTLPDTTLVIPGHGQATTIGQERELNPFLQR